jgi:exodeoxyribonuclease V gamma subunit
VRSEDRQLLLDALLAAQDHLVVTYSGRDERSNQPRPPAVPVGELLDVVDHTVRAPEGLAREAIVVHHPLQPFNPRNFEAGELVGTGPWSFDSLHLAGAEAALSPRRAPSPFLADPLAPFETNPAELDQMEKFLRHPVRAFLRERLHVSLRSKTREFEDAIPIDLDGLEKWQIADRVLQEQLAGASQDACLDAEVARGALPPGELAGSVLGDMTGPLDELVRAGLRAQAPESIDVRVDLPGGQRLVGTVAGVRGDVVHTVTYSKLGPAPRLLAWLRLLALTATAPDRKFEACTVGRSNKRGATITVARIGPLGPDAASRKTMADGHLASLVDLYQRGMREPLPLYLKTSAAWATAVDTGRDAAADASSAWTSGYRFDGENKDAEHLLVLGEDLTFDDLLGSCGAPVGEEGNWEVSEATRFGVFARRLWDGLLAHEELTDR